MTKPLLAVLCAAVLTAACSRPEPPKTPSKDNPRAQLEIGYSLLYQEANGIPKMRFIFMTKDKSEAMKPVVDGVIQYYQQLAESMERLSRQYPGARIDVSPMSEIEGDMRKAIGVDQAKDFAPIIGKSGMAFERELLLLFFNALDEQSHLVGVMIERETDPNLKTFLTTTKSQLDAQHARVEALLERKYFVH